MFKRPWEMTENDRVKAGEMCGKIMLWILDGRSICHMAEKLNLHPYQVESNIDQMLYTLRKRVGFWRYIKMAFRK